MSVDRAPGVKTLQVSYITSFLSLIPGADNPTLLLQIAALQTRTRGSVHPESVFYSPFIASTDCTLAYTSLSNRAWINRLVSSQDPRITWPRQAFLSSIDDLGFPEALQGQEMDSLGGVALVR